MNKITLCLIAKNEENNIKRCIDSIYDFVDEIIVTDTGSTDKTKEIVKLIDKCKLYEFEWINDFSAARNYCLSKVTTDYWMWLDCDDVIKEDDLKILMDLKKDIHKHQIISMDYDYGFDNEDYLTGKPTLTLVRNRIFKTSLGCKWHDRIHEYVDTNGAVYKTKAKVSHTRTHSNGTRNLDIFKEMITNNEEFSDRSQYYCAKEFYYNGIYNEAEERLLDVVYNRNNWFEEKLQALQALITISKVKNKKEDIKKYCYKSFDLVGTPRSEFLYELGNLFFNENKLQNAIFWYNLAGSITPPPDASFVNPDCYGVLPHLQLSVCYYKLGDINKSKEENEIAAKFNPNNSSVIYNKKFFESLK